MNSLYESLAQWSKWAWPLLVNHLWQATLFFLFVLIISFSIKRAPARSRYSLWLVALTKFVLPCVAIASLMKQAGVDFAALFASTSGSQASAATISPFLSPIVSPHEVLHFTESAMPGIKPAALTYAVPMQNQGYLYVILTFVWIIGCALLLGLWMRKVRLLSSVVRSGKMLTSGREFETLERVRSWLGLRRKVLLIVSSEIAEPGVWRIFKPTVLLPEGISNRLSEGELETIMMHELVHVERWDNLIGIIQRMVCCLLWFHPLIWLLDRRLLAEREQSCDDTVIRLSGASDVYASGIKKICRHSIGWELTGLSSAAGSDLKKRIKRIVETNLIRSPSVLHQMLTGLVVVVLIVLSAAVGLVNKSDAAAQTDAPGVAQADPRFVAMDSEVERKVAVTQGKDSKTSTLQLPDALVLTKKLPDITVEIRDNPGQIESFASTGIIAEAAPPRNEIQPPPPQATTDLPAPNISAALVPIAESHADLSGFVGRYEVDPAAVENFVLDITLEHGELWLKPSHTVKRKLLQTGDLSFSDNKSDFRLTFMQGSEGRIIGLRIDSWNSGSSARKLTLPQPSLSGNTTFRLSGFPNARIVAVAGSFNNWNQSQFLFAKVDGEWICKINLPPGKHEYKFIVDGNWLVDPRNPKTMHDERGNENSVLVAE